MRKSFKIISLILVVSLFVSCLPVYAFAEENDQTTTTSAVSANPSELEAPSVNDDSIILYELPEKRQENVKQFLLKDATIEAVVYPTVVHYKDSEGNYKDIDNTLIDSVDEDNNNVLENKDSDFKVKIAKNTESNNLIKINENNYEISWNVIDANKANSEIIPSDKSEYNSLSPDDQKKTLTKLSSNVLFKDVFDGVDFKYNLQPESIKESIIINKNYDNIEYKFDLNLKNLIPKLNNDNSVSFYDENDTSKIVYRMQAPYMTDSNGVNSSDISVSLDKNDKGYLLTITPGKEWLNDAERVYPVIIDPTLRSDKIVPQGTYVDSTNPNTNYYLQSPYKVSTTCWTFLNPSLPGIPSDSLIIDARLLLYVQSVTNSTNVEIHKINQNYDISTLTYNSMPINFDGPVKSAISYCNGFPPYYNIWNITSLVKNWYKNGNYYGIFLQATTAGATANFYTFLDSSDMRPVYEVTYMSKTGLEDYWSYHTMDLGRSGTAYVNDCSGNSVYSHNDLTMNGNRTPINLVHYYNSTNTTNSGYGTGWQLSYNQKVEYVTIQTPGQNDSQTYYVYTDGDGTKHYFGFDSSSGLYKDESGLNFTLKKNTDNTYTITDKINDKLNFNTSGYLSSICDNNNNTITIGYTNGLITTITDGAGRVTKLNYSNGKLHDIVDPSQRTIATYEYTGSLLTKITYNDTKYTSYGYDANNKLNSVTGIDNRQIGITYINNSVSQLLFKNIDGTLGKQWDIAYGQNTTTFTDEISRIYTYQFNTYGNTTCIIFPDHSAQYTKYVNDNKQRGLYPAYSAPDTTMNKPGITSKIQKTIENYLQNHNMELTSNIVWTANSTADSQGTSSVTTEAKYIGNQSLKIYKTNNAGKHYYSQKLTNLTAGVPYTLSCYVRTMSISKINNKGANLFITYNLSGVQQIVKSIYVNGDNNWQRVELQFTLPQGYDSSSLYINLGIEGETGYAYFDCAQIEKGNVANSYNLVDNGGATNSISNYWTITGPCPISSGPSFLSLKAFHFMDSYTNENAYQTINISGNAGDTFVASAWGQASADQNGYYKIIVTFNNTDGTTSVFSIPFNALIKDWQYVSDKVTADKAYTSVKYTICYDYNINGSYFCGMQLCKEGYGNSYSYDSNGNLTNITDAANNHIDLLYTNNNITNITNEKNENTGCTYDANHNLKTYTSPQGIKSTYDYDSYGNVLTEKTGVFDNYYIKFANTYTTDGNYLKTSTNALNNTVTCNYSLTKGTIDNFVDAAGKTTTYTYNPNRDILTDVTETVDGQVINNHYDCNNDYLSKITHNGFYYNFNYNSLGNLTKTLVGNQSLVQNTYEPRTSRLTDLIYGNGQKVSLTYDNMNRVTAQKYNDNIRTTYDYDSYGNLGFLNDLVNGISYRYLYDAKNQLTKITDSLGNISKFEYDVCGNNTKIYEKLNGQEYTTDYICDGDNRQWETTLPGGQTVDYYYDSTYGTGNLTDTYTQLRYGHYIVHYDYYYNNPSEATRLINGITNGNDSIYYTYDERCNIKTVGPNWGGILNRTEYYYNELNELIREDNIYLNKTITYTYDVGGNITYKKEYSFTKDTTLGTPIKTYSYIYDSTWKDKLTNYDGKAISYDQIGNPLTYNGWTYTWELGRQLSSATNSGNSISYKYNDDGFRTQKNVNGVITNYHLVGDKVTSETNGTDTIYYVYDANGKLICMSLNGWNYYYVFNVQGDIIGLYDETGTQVVSYLYDTWGKLISITGTMANTVGVKNPYRYRGYRYDTETGLYYLQSRYYSPEWGRFLNADNISYCKPGELLSFNLFAYCNNNPVNMVDSDGRCGWMIFGTVIGAAASGGFQIVINIAKGKRGWAILDGVLGATLGGAVSGAILSINPSATVLAASLGAAVQTVTNNLIDAVSNHKNVDMAFIWNTVAQTIVSATLGAAAGKLISEAIPINSGWIKPDKIMSILTGAYGTKFRDQTMLSSMLNTAFNIFTTKPESN